MRIAEFLLARIGEDEAVAKDQPIDAHIHQSGCYYYNYSLDANWFCDCDEDGKASSRILAECAAKRAIVAAAVAWGPPMDHTLDEIGIQTEYAEILGHLAAVYADHPDYRQEWA